MRRLALASSLMVLVLGAASCGSDDNNAATKTTATKTGTTKTSTTETTTTEPGDASSPDDAAVRKALVAWGQSDTAPEACALMSARVKRGLLDHDAAACRSKKKLEKLLGVELKPSDLKVKKVAIVGEQAVARVDEEIPDTKGKRDTQVYYLVKESGSWKVDSVGQPPPGAPSLPTV